MTAPNSWEVTTLLCDYAQVADGKLFIAGGGWSIIGPGPFTQALAIKILVPWDEANRRHKLNAILYDQDGQRASVGEAGTTVGFETQFEVGRPPGLPAGTALDFPLAVNIGPIGLGPNQGFIWEVSIDDQPVDRVAFRTRAPR